MGTLLPTTPSEHLFGLTIHGRFDTSTVYGPLLPPSRFIVGAGPSPHGKLHAWFLLLDQVPLPKIKGIGTCPHKQLWTHSKEPPKYVLFILYSCPFLPTLAPSN